MDTHFKNLVARVGLPQLRLHDLRHTNASLALQAGVDLKVVSERLGHSQLAITADLYTHVHRGLGQEAADRIAGALRPSPNHPSDALPAASLPQPPENGPDSAVKPGDAALPSDAAGPSSQVTGSMRPPLGESRRGDSNP
ncbi:MAG: tyrosine-type recombinase/integrase [Lapillicoccus sp.]